MKDYNPTNTSTEFGLKLNKDHEGKKVDNTLYKQIVGSLMYLTAIRPDIMYSVSLINRYMENPTKMHMLAAKRILRYLQGTRDFGIFYRKGGKQFGLGLLTLIMLQEIKMIERVLQGMSLCLAQVLFHGHLKSNQL